MDVSRVGMSDRYVFGIFDCVKYTDFEFMSVPSHCGPP
jgi:hypothetical protein